MSKRIYRIILPLVILGLMAAGLLARGFSGASAQRAAVTGSTSRAAAIVAATAEILRETSEIRELQIIRPVKSGAQSRAEIERMLVKKLNEQMTRDEMHATELNLRKFGLVPEGFEYRPFIIKLLTEQVAGYYDARSREFYLADWLELEGQKPVMAHELTHALQDQHFNLRRFEKWPEGDSDARLAAHALIEGDATLAMTLYMARNPLLALAFTRSLAGNAAASKQYNEAPRAMRDTLIFPYFQGTEWATSVYKRGGWKMVSDAFTKLPLSSEQILHPEKYFAYEPPVKVRLGDLTDLLNANSKQQAATSNHHPAGLLQQGSSPNKAKRPKRVKRQGDDQQAPESRRPTLSRWERIDTDVNGEWSYFLILDQFLNSSSESKRAAAGWAGDRYALYEGPGGQVLLAHVSQWDTEGDAEQFFNAYVQRSVLRYPGATLLPESSDNDTRRRLQTREGKVVIELRGSRVVVLEGIPTGLGEEGLMKTLE